MHTVLWTAALAMLFAQPVHALSPPYAQARAPATAPAHTLSLSAALKLADRHSPAIAAALHELGASDGALRQAGAHPNPELTSTMEDQERATRTTTIQINQAIELGNKRSARLAVATHVREKVLSELARIRADVKAAVIVGYCDVLSAQESQRLAMATLDIARRTSATAQRRVAAGKASPVEETKARIAEAGARNDAAQAEAALATARRRLATTWGDGEAVFGMAEGKLDELPMLPPIDSLLSRLEVSPWLSQARIEVERRAAMTRLERARTVPDVTLSVGAKRDRQLGRDQAIFGVSIPLPLFDRNQGNIIEASNREGRAQDDLSMARNDAAGAMRQAHAQWESARHEAELYANEILPGARSAYDAASKGFEYGKFAFLDVLDAQRTLILSSENHLRALAATHRAAAEVERILGTPIQIQQQETK